MAYEIPGCTNSYEAGADLSANQFFPVIMEDDGQVNIAGGQGVATIGFLQNKPSAAGRAATVMHSGVTKAIAGAAIDVSAAGRWLTANTDGVETAATGDFVCGYYLGATDVVEGDVISVLIVAPSPVASA